MRLVVKYNNIQQYVSARPRTISVVRDQIYLFTIGAGVMDVISLINPFARLSLSHYSRFQGVCYVFVTPLSTCAQHARKCILLNAYLYTTRVRGIIIIIYLLPPSAVTVIAWDTPLLSLLLIPLKDTTLVFHCRIHMIT